MMFLPLRGTARHAASNREAVVAQNLYHRTTCGPRIPTCDNRARTTHSSSPFPVLRHLSHEGRQHYQTTGGRPHTPTSPQAAAFGAVPVPPGLYPAKEGSQRSRSQTEQQEAHNELHSLHVAIVANILILIAKVCVHVMTGSSSLLAEALHSLADVGNQALLRIGVTQSERAPTALHPYGYARDRFIWALISAVGIFFLGAGASFIHGVHTLFDTRVLQPTIWTYAVLGVSMVLEGYSLWVATRAMMAGAKARRLSLLEYIRGGASPTTLAVMLEDGGAVLGLLIAMGCTALADLTGNAMWDAGGSILVGCLLGAIAAYLVQRNRQILIGRSMNKREVTAVMDLLQCDPVVSHVLETKTEEVGPNVFRFKAEVAWNGRSVVQRYMERMGRDRIVAAVRTALDSNDKHAIDGVLKDYGRDIINAVGAEVDRLELQIQIMNPGIKWVDLETDRGRGLSLGNPRSVASMSSVLSSMENLGGPIPPPPADRGYSGPRSSSTGDYEASTGGRATHDGDSRYAGSGNGAATSRSCDIPEVGPGGEWVDVVVSDGTFLGGQPMASPLVEKTRLR